MHPPAAFLRNFLVRRGFRDGTAGFLISILNSYYVFLKVLKLWELQRELRPFPQDSADASNGRRRPKFARRPNINEHERDPQSTIRNPDPQSAIRNPDPQSTIRNPQS
jgi:hypothetical protein